MSSIPDQGVMQKYQKMSSFQSILNARSPAFYQLQYNSVIMCIKPNDRPELKITPKSRLFLLFIAPLSLGRSLVKQLVITCRKASYYFAFREGACDFRRLDLHPSALPPHAPSHNATPHPRVLPTLQLPQYLHSNHVNYKCLFMCYLYR